MVTKINHTGFVVTNLEESVDFYVNVVGLTMVVRRERSGELISRVLGYPDTQIKAALLGLEGEEGHILELIEYVSPESSARPSEERAIIGASHLAFNVKNIHETYANLIAAGSRQLHPPVEISSDRIICYLQDPDGNWIELIEIKEN